MKAISKPKVTHKINQDITVKLTDPSQLITTQGLPCIDAGRTRLNGEIVDLKVRYDNKPKLLGKVEQWEKDWKSYQVSKAENLHGLKELRKAKDTAYNEMSRYRAELSEMMYTGHSIEPKPMDDAQAEKAKELAEKHPRANLYLIAEDYTLSNNSNKYSAGKEAMELIAHGGDLKDAREILDNWLPESAQWH